MVPLPEAMPGTNGLAIAALVLGILGLVPPLGIIAIVLGAVALQQVTRRNQSGRGLAIAGIVLGSLAVLAWIAISAVLVFSSEPERSASGATRASRVHVADLKGGDCFSGGQADDVSMVTVVPCAEPHESQVVTVFELPEGDYPGEEKVTSAAEQGCSEKADPLVREDRYDVVEPSFIYPADAWTWDGSRAIQCTVDATSGTVTGSALKAPPTS